MFVIVLFIVMMLWFYAAFNIVKSWGVALLMFVLGCLVPMGMLAFALNLAWYLYKHHKNDANPLSS